MGDIRNIFGLSNTTNLSPETSSSFLGHVRRTKAWDINPFLVPFTESVVELARIECPPISRGTPDRSWGSLHTRLTLA
jgi:hypothetical protein